MRRQKGSEKLRLSPTFGGSNCGKKIPNSFFPFDVNIEALPKSTKYNLDRNAHEYMTEIAKKQINFLTKPYIINDL